MLLLHTLTSSTSPARLGVKSMAYDLENNDGVVAKMGGNMVMG